jgi:hypothetical protein
VRNYSDTGKEGSEVCTREGFEGENEMRGAKK